MAATRTRIPISFPAYPSPTSAYDRHRPRRRRRGREMLVGAVPPSSCAPSWRDWHRRRLGNLHRRQRCERDRERHADDDVGDAARHPSALSAGHIATLSGPSHAEEVSRQIPTTVVAASARSRHGAQRAAGVHAAVFPGLREQRSPGRGARGSAEERHRDRGRDHRRREPRRQHESRPHDARHRGNRPRRRRAGRARADLFRACPASAT